MSSSYGFQTSSELLEKVKRDQKRISKAIEKLDDLEIKDSIYDFCNTAYSIKDWLEEEGVDKKLLNQYFADENVLKVLQLICTANKHQNANKMETGTSVRITGYNSQSPNVSSTVILASSSIPVNAETIYIYVDDINVADGGKNMRSYTLQSKSLIYGRIS